MKKPWIILIGAVVFTLVLGIGAVAGGAAAYFLLQDDIPAVFASPGEVNSEDGVIISHVDENSPAAEAGLVRGDILMKIGDEETNSLPDLMAVLKDHDPGDMIEMTVLHGDDLRTMSVELGERDGNTYLGITTCIGTMRGEMMISGEPFDLDREIVIIKGEGTLITEVVEDGPADTAGLLVGDTILSVNGDEIEPGTALADLITAYEPGDVVKLEVLRDGEELEIEVKLTENPEKPGQAYLGVVYSSGMPGMQFDKDGGWRFFFDKKLPIPFEDLEDKDLPFFHHEFPGIHSFEDLPEGVENAIIIGEVIEGTPAEEAGLKEDDLILYLDGDPVEELRSFVADIQSRDPGDQVNLTIFRDSEEIEISVTLAEHPDDPSNGYLGVIVSGVIKMNFEGEMPGDFEFDLDKELKLPGGDA